MEEGVSGDPATRVQGLSTCRVRANYEMKWEGAGRGTGSEQDRIREKAAGKGDSGGGEPGKARCYEARGRSAPCANCAVARVLTTGRVLRYERTLRGEEGSVRRAVVTVSPVLDGQGRPQEALVLMQDVTGLESVDAEDADRQRLASLGLLTAGIIHNLNNILGSLAGHADLALLYPRDNEVSAKALAVISRDSDRAATVLREVVRYARGGEGEEGSGDAAEIFENVMKTLNADFDCARIAVAREFERVGTIRGEPWTVRRMMLAMMKGVADSARPGSQVSVRLRRQKGVVLSVSYEADRPCPAEEEGGECPLSIPGKGRGDAFALAEELAAQLGVRMSRTRRGDRAEVRAHLGASAQVKESDETSGRRSERGDSRMRVLVVDDEESIRSVMEAMLVADGQEVALAADGEEALARATEATPDVIFLDLLMPGKLSGAQTLARLRERCPRSRIVLMTGQTVRALSQDQTARADGQLLKPFHRHDVLGALR